MKTIHNFLILIICVILAFTHDTNSQIKQDSTAEITKIAIVLGGAVSLGSFQAGVIWETLKLLKTNDFKEKYEIDLMVGASAGSMMLSLIAKDILEHNPKYNSSTNNIYYNPWVKEIDIKNLLPENSNSKYLFDSDVVENISLKYIENRVSHAKKLSIAADTIILAMTLSNFDGLNYKIGFHNKRVEKKIYNDQIVFSITSDGSTNTILRKDSTNQDIKDKSQSWSDISKAAQASGAFPFAFEPVVFQRYEEEYAGNPTVFDDEDIVELKYIDGGVLNNDPLNLAVKLAKKLDSNFPNRKRTYFYIDAKGNTNSDSNKDGEFVQHVKKLITTYTTTASNTDFRELVTVNNDVSFWALYNDPDSVKLAGQSYAAMGGFFNEEIRKYDYLAGRYTAQQFFKNNKPFEHKFTDEILIGELRENYNKLFSSINFDSAYVNDPTLYEHFENTELRKEFYHRIMQKSDDFFRDSFLGHTAANITNEVLKNNLYYEPPQRYYRIGLLWDTNYSELQLSYSINPFGYLKDFQPFNNYGKITWYNWLWWSSLNYFYITPKAGYTFGAFNKIVESGWAPSNLNLQISIKTKLFLPFFPYIKFVPEIGYVYYDNENNFYGKKDFRVLKFGVELFKYLEFNYQIFDDAKRWNIIAGFNF